MSKTLSEATTNITIYESSPHYQAYLSARAAWILAHDAYMSSKCDITFTALRHAYTAMHDALTICRTRPEHMAAFGW
jgi:hypothetical protein